MTQIDEPDARPEDFVQSVGRALHLLEVVSATPGLPVKSLARRCGLNISTTYHLVRTLAYEGYLDRLPNGTYVAGTEVARRFYDLLGSMGRPRSSTVVLRHLAERTGLSAYLGRLSGGRVVVAEVAEGRGSPYLEDFEAGLEVSAHATALGKVLLSSMTRRERRSYLAEQGLQPFTRNTRTDLEVLEAELTSVPAGAALVEHGEFRDGVVCAAGLVPKQRDEAPTWALVISARGEEMPLPARNELMLAAGDLAGGPG